MFSALANTKKLVAVSEQLRYQSPRR